MRIFPCLLLVLSYTTLAPLAAVTPGDRDPGVRLGMPDAVLYQNGGHVIDITRPPASLPIDAAVGDGVTDDTAAFVSYYDWLLEQIAPLGSSFSRADPGGDTANYVLYVPDGTYRITDTLIYSSPLRYDPQGSNNITSETTGEQPNFTAEVLVKLRIFGESRAGTIFRLDDDLPAFNTGTPRPVLSWGKGTDNNCVAYNALRNCTIDVGNGNPDAVAIKWGGANNAGISNVRLVAGADSGAVGIGHYISANIGSNADIRIEGFAIGIDLPEYHMFSPNYEHLTLVGQREAGIRVDDCPVQFRAVRSENTVPAIRTTDDGNHVVVLDSAFVGGAGGPAIDHDGGQLFLRDVTSQGYDALVQSTTHADLSATSTSEWRNGDVWRFDASQPTTSMRLPVREHPALGWSSDPADWAVVEDFPGATDAERIQNACNSGKSVIWFGKQTYDIDDEISVPASVTHLALLYTRFTGSGWAFAIDQASATPLRLMDYNGKGGNRLVRSTSDRMLICDNLGTNSKLYANESGGPVRLLGRNLNGLGKGDDSLIDADIWVRCANIEFKGGPNFNVDRGDFWAMGFKVEGAVTNFLVKADGRLEVLGGVTNIFSGDVTGIQAFIIEDGGQASIIACENGAGGSDPNHFDIVVEDQHRSPAHQIMFDELPQRVGRNNHWFLPLYTHYTPSSDSTAPAAPTGLQAAPVN